MTRADDQPGLRLDDVEAVVAETCFPERPDERRPGRVGLELERFPIHRDGRGAPAGRCSLATTMEVLERFGGPRLGARGERRGLPAWRLSGAGDLTFEPGGQIEHVTNAHATAAEALAEVTSVSGSLAGAFDAAGGSVASAGIDVWNDVESVPLQLQSWRYPAMDAYLAARGSLGRVMMRHTCSLQVNLDLGPPGDRLERWTLANLLAPLLTATFASSPVDGGVCGRAAAWQVLDSTRTGFPVGFSDASLEDPVSQMTASALAADVLLVRTSDQTADPGRPGWTFRDWLTDGHPEYGRPSAGDLAYHLSTIFLEVRPRGVLEFRGIDAVPHPWRSAPVILLVGALEDPVARGRLIELLEPARSDLAGLWHRSARSGVADPAFCALAVEVWSYALAGAARLPDDYLPTGGLGDVEVFLERFTLRGRCPADELREQLIRGPAVSLAWAAEPVPEDARSSR